MSNWSLATLIMNFLFGKRITKIKFVSHKFKSTNIEKNEKLEILFGNKRYFKL
jgi:hypothetical protein